MIIFKNTQQIYARKERTNCEDTLQIYPDTKAEDTVLYKTKGIKKPFARIPYYKQVLRKSEDAYIAVEHELYKIRWLPDLKTI